MQCHHRFKNGKDHCHWSIAEKVRTHRGWVQRPLLYLGAINDSQKAAWTKVIEVFDPARGQTLELALYPAERAVPEPAAAQGVQVRLSEFELRHPRQWGACWVGCQLWDQLHLEEFWRARLPDCRQGTCWRQVLQSLVIYRSIAPGSEWRLHRQWFKNSAMANLLGEDFSLAHKDTLYRCSDKVLAHREALFQHLRRHRLKGLVQRLKDLQQMELTRDQLLLKLGAAKAQYPTAWRLMDLQVSLRARLRRSARAGMLGAGRQEANSGAQSSRNSQAPRSHNATAPPGPSQMKYP